MGRPVVHFEVIGQDPVALRRFYGELFEWEYVPGGDPNDIVGDYGFIEPMTSSGGVGIPGGVGGGPGFEARAHFYVAVPDVEAALVAAEALGGTRVSGPLAAPGGGLVVGFFADPEGNVIGLANAV